MATIPPPPDQVSYDFADAVPLPGDIGVHDGNSMDQLVTNVKGVNYFLDVIAFGDKSLLNDPVLQLSYYISQERTWRQRG